MSNADLTHMGRKRRDVHGEPLPTETRACLRCRKPFESEGPHHRLCGPCASRASETSPYAVYIVCSDKFRNSLKSSFKAVQGRGALLVVSCEKLGILEKM